MPTQIQTPWGEPVVFPDGVPDDEMLSALDSLAMDRQNRAQFQSLPPIAQAMTQVFSDFTGQQEPYQIPTIPGNTFGMTTQDMAQVRGTIQQTQQLNAGEMIRQRVEREKQMEAEKDRAQQFKVENTRFQNQLKMADFDFKMAQELEKARAEGNLAKQRLIEEERTRREAEKFGQQVSLQQLRGEQRMEQIGAQAENQRRIAAMRASQGGASDGNLSPMGSPQQIVNPDTGEVELVQYFRDGTYSVLGKPPQPQQHDRLSPSEELRLEAQAQQNAVQQVVATLGPEAVYLDPYNPNAGFTPEGFTAIQQVAAKNMDAYRARFAPAPAQPQQPQSSQQPPTGVAALAERLRAMTTQGAGKIVVRQRVSSDGKRREVMYSDGTTAVEEM